MGNLWVINASPIIFYARIEHLCLISELASEIIVPGSVLEEIRQGHDKDASADRAISWASQYQHKNLTIASSVAHWDLGAGESQVITYCLEYGGRAVVDDRMARRCIYAHGLQVVGSLGIVLSARRNGLVEKARPMVYDLISAGLYLDRTFAEKSLALVGE